jgi:ABC-type sugar transport system ATPase subunit
VFSPQVLLMDEPFSNLDARLRDRMGEELRELHSDLGVTTVYVTHDQSEAMLLSDRVVVMEAGRVLQYDTPLEVALRPRSKRVASSWATTPI